MFFRKKQTQPIQDPNKVLLEQIQKRQEMNLALSKAEKKLSELKSKEDKFIAEAVLAKRTGNTSLYEIKLNSLGMAKSSYNKLQNILNVFYGLKDKKEMDETVAELINSFTGLIQPASNQSTVPNYAKMLEDLNQKSKEITTESLLLDDIMNKIQINLEYGFESNSSISRSTLENEIDKRIKLEEARETTVDFVNKQYPEFKNE